MSLEGVNGDLGVKRGLKRGLPGPPRHVEFPHSTCPTPLYPKIKIGVHPRDTRHVEMSRPTCRDVPLDMSSAPLPARYILLKRAYLGLGNSKSCAVCCVGTQTRRAIF